ncbi:MAG: hypothetical protein NTY07_04960 [Bacteroidia bacterium]|nr:hypothetical protein [Bacteroidia bacterium]
MGFITGLSCQISNGQSLNELRKLWQNNNFIFLTEKDKDKLFSSADFYKYALTLDEEFTEYLKETWHDYSIFARLSDEYLKRPIQQPVFDDADLVMNPPANLPYSKVVGFNNNRTGQVKLIPRIRKPESHDFNSVNGQFRFFGQPISISYDKLLVLSKINSVSEDSISEFWKSFARTNSNQLVDQLMDYRDLLGLGDWGYFQLVKVASNHIFPDNPLNADLLTWALMIRSGFDVRVAFNQSSMTILFPSENTIYSRQFVVIDKKRFYLDREMNSQLLVTYQNPFPDNVGMIDLEFHKALNFNGKLMSRKILYHWNNKNYEFTLRFNSETIQFYNDYPETDPEIYFGAPVSSILKEDLLGQFFPLLSKMDKTEAAAFLQQFVQKEFDYVSVNQKDGLAPSRFSEQIIASKSGDDRSKSVLFSWLVRILLRSPVVGVQFPGCYSTAICFDEPLDGDFFYFNRGKYYITDPTFLKAPIGVMMPEFAGLSPQIIDLSSSVSQPGKAIEIWKLALKMGARRGGISQDVIFDRRGKSLIAGYLTYNLSYYPFVACFSEGNSLQWIRKFEGDGKAVAFAISKLSDDEIYVAGSFSGMIEMDGVALQSGINNADLFIAQLNQKGELIWMNKAGIDSTAQDESITYMVKFDRSGGNISTQWSNEDERNIKTGFGETSDNKLCFTGSGNSTPGMVPLSWTANKSDISSEIYKEYNLLIGNKCHPKVAGIVAVMKLLQKTESEVTGIQLQRLITRYNSSFPINNPWLFKAIGLIQQLKNENGILSLRTIGGKPFIFSNMKLEDGARFNLSVFGNGDLSIGIISGFQMLVKQVTLPLNCLLIDCSSGNMILDYDVDHTLKTVSFGIIQSPK